MFVPRVCAARNCTRSGFAQVTLYPGERTSPFTGVPGRRLDLCSLIAPVQGKLVLVCWANASVMQLSSRGCSPSVISQQHQYNCTPRSRLPPRPCLIAQLQNKACAIGKGARTCAKPHRAAALNRSSASQSLTGDTLTSDEHISRSEVVSGQRPILSGGGGGIFFFWQLGTALHSIIW